MNLPETTLKVLSALRESGEREFTNRFGHKWRVANLPKTRLLLGRQGFPLTDKQWENQLKILAQVGLFSKYDGAQEALLGDVRVAE